MHFKIKSPIAFGSVSREPSKSWTEVRLWLPRLAYLDGDRVSAQLSLLMPGLWRTRISQRQHGRIWSPVPNGGDA